MKNNILASIVFLSATLAGCGMDMSKCDDGKDRLENGNCPKAAASATDVANTDSSAPKDKAKAKEPKAKKSGSTVTVDVETKVTVKVETADGSEEEKQWMFNGRLKTFQKFSDDVPEGYRLATLSETLAALEAGKLDDFGNVSVWTGTVAKDRSDQHYTVNLGMSSPVIAIDQASHQSLYIQE